MTSLGIAILVCRIIVCVGARKHQLIPMNPFFWLRRHSGHELDLGKSNLNWLTIKLLFNLFTFDRCIRIWYTNMEVIIPVYLSIELFWCFYIQCFGILFFLWLSTDTRTRLSVRHLTFLVDYCLPSPCVLNHWRIFPDIRCLWRMISSIRCRYPSVFELVSLAYDVCCMGLKMPRWVNPMLPLICMNPNFLRVILYWCYTR
jgi:hypothetical protein